MGLFGLIVLGLCVDLHEAASNNILSKRQTIFFDLTIPEL